MGVKCSKTNKNKIALAPESKRDFAVLRFLTRVVSSLAIENRGKVFWKKWVEYKLTGVVNLLI